MPEIDLWERRLVIPGISEGEFTEQEIEAHNLKYGTIYPGKDIKEDDKLYTKKRIRERLKELRAECYQLLAEGAEDSFAAICNQSRLERLNRRIREYQYRLRDVPKGRGTEITPDTIRRAKESPISDYLVGWKSRRTGRTLVGKCPLPGHSESTGSFTVYPEQNRWHCFGQCGIGGDVIDLVCKTQNLSFISAVKFLNFNQPPAT
jgi:hypothetical protein